MADTASIASRILYLLERPMSVLRGPVSEETRARWVAGFLERSMGSDSGASVVPVQYQDGSWRVEIRVWAEEQRQQRYSTFLGIPVHTICPGERSNPGSEGADRERGKRRNPVTQRTTLEALYRSVSPGEYRDILLTGRIIGRGGWFSGDERNLIFFAPDMDSVIGQGEDIQRYVTSLPDIRAKLEKKEEFYNVYLDLLGERDRLYGDDGFYNRMPDAMRRRIDEASKRFFKEQKKVFAEVDRMAKQVKEQNRRDGATSYILEFQGLADGTLHTGTESYHWGPEVGFERGAVTLEHLARVHIVLEGKIVRVLDAEEALQLGPTPNAPRRSSRRSSTGAVGPVSP